MPRRSIAHVALFSSAESPVLPFLAPRAFAESPIGRTTKRWTAANSVQEAEETGLKSRRSQQSSSSAPSGKNKKTCAGRFSCQSTLIAPRPTCCSTPSPYIHISSFVRGQLRLHSTSGIPAYQNESTNSVAGASSFGDKLPEISKSIPHIRKGHVGERPSRPPAIKKGIAESDEFRDNRLRVLQSVQNALNVSQEYIESRGCRPAFDGHSRILQRREKYLEFAEPATIDLRSAPNDESTDNWTYLFSALARNFDDVQFRQWGHPVKILHDEEYRARDEALSQVSKSARENLWAEFEAKGASWQYMLLYFLEHSPPRALDFLNLEKYDRSRPPGIVSDALWYISRFYLSEARNGRSVPAPNVLVPRFLEHFDRYLSNFKWLVSQDLLYCLLRLSMPEQMKALYDYCCAKGMKFRWYTLVHFANALGKVGEYEYGLNALTKVVHDNPNVRSAIVQSDVFRKSCKNVLRRSVVNGTNYDATTRIVQEILALGVELDLTTHTIIIHNAVEAGDFQTAFRVYNVLEDAGMTPNAYTYAILLSGCKNSNDPGIFRDFADHCADKALELQDPWIATEYLHYLYVCLENEDITQRCRVLGEVYSRFFHCDIFWNDLVLQKVPFRKRSRDSAGRMTPSLAALSIMISLELQCRGKDSPHTLSALYQEFRDLILTDHPLISQLSEKDHTYNAFLLAFCQHPNLLREALNMFRDMTTATAPRKPAPGDTGAPIRYHSAPTPTVQTWTILMHGFVRANQMTAAEKVLALLKQRGLTPDTVTWATLLQGYTRAQKVGKIAAVMKQLEVANGKDVGGWTVHSLGKVVERTKLTRMLERWDHRRMPSTEETSDPHLTPVESGASDGAQQVQSTVTAPEERDLMEDDSLPPELPEQLHSTDYQQRLEVISSQVSADTSKAERRRSVEQSSPISYTIDPFLV